MKYQYEVEDAKRFGSADIATIISNIRFWLYKNKANGTNIKDGRVWTYNSLKAFQDLFPWMTANQLRTAIKKLTDSGLLLKDNFNKNPYDRTAWYSIDEPEFVTESPNTDDWPMCENSHMEVWDSTHASIKNSHMEVSENTNPSVGNHKSSINTDDKSNSKPDTTSGANAQKGKTKFPKVTDEHLQLAQELYDRLVEMYGDEAPLRRTNIRAWANDIRLLLEESKETPESVSKFIKFLHTDKGKVASFWKTNILSGKKIRERIAEVRLKAAEEKRIKAEQQREQQQRDIKFGNIAPEKIPHNIVDEHGDTIPNPDMFPDAAFNAQARNKRRRYLKQLAEQEAAQKENGA